MTVAECVHQRAKYPPPEVFIRIALGCVTAAESSTPAGSAEATICAVLTDLKTLMAPAVTTPRRVATAFALAESQ